MNSSKNESSGALSDMLDLILVNSNKNESSGSRESICFIYFLSTHKYKSEVETIWVLFCVSATVFTFKAIVSFHLAQILHYMSIKNYIY